MRFISIICLVTVMLTTADAPGRSIEIERVEYRILSRWQPESGPTQGIIRLDIDINQRLDETGYKELVRRVAREQKLGLCETIDLYFYYNLDQFLPDIGHQGIAQKNRAHLLASYTWNKVWASRQGGGTLRLFKDRSGNDLQKPKNLPFDHLSPVTAK